MCLCVQCAYTGPIRIGIYRRCVCYLSFFIFAICRFFACLRLFGRFTAAHTVNGHGGCTETMNNFPLFPSHFSFRDFFSFFSATAAFSVFNIFSVSPVCNFFPFSIVCVCISMDVCIP